MKKKKDINIVMGVESLCAAGFYTPLTYCTDQVLIVTLSIGLLTAL